MLCLSTFKQQPRTTNAKLAVWISIQKWISIFPLELDSVCVSKALVYLYRGNKAHIWSSYWDGTDDSGEYLYLYFDYTDSYSIPNAWKGAYPPRALVICSEESDFVSDFMSVEIIKIKLFFRKPYGFNSNFLLSKLYFNASLTWIIYDFIQE